MVMLILAWCACSFGKPTQTGSRNRSIDQSTPRVSPGLFEVPILESSEPAPKFEQIFINLLDDRRFSIITKAYDSQVPMN
jgi:hypothetical protein